MAMERQPREGDVLNRKNVERRRRMVDGALHRQQRTRRASRLVVAVMQVRPAFFGMRDGARFITREGQRSADDSQLANRNQ